MSPGAITDHIDVAQIVLYMFWVFFAGLVYYLHQESKREGYPLERDGRAGRAVIEGFPAIPVPKTFTLQNGQVWTALQEGPFKPVVWETGTSVSADQEAQRLVFDPTGVADPYRLTLRRDGKTRSVTVDGAGEVTVDG